MKSYDDERKALFDWYLEQRNACEKERDEEMKQFGLQRDSQANYKFQCIHLEYLKKLHELHRKYGVPESTEELSSTGSEDYESKLYRILCDGDME